MNQQITRPVIKTLPDPLDIKATDDFFEALANDEIEFQGTGMKDEVETREGDKNAKSKNQAKLSEAVELVNAAIREEWERYDKVAHTEEGDPVMVEGETHTGVIVHALVDPKEIAKIYLEYDYPTTVVLGDDAPQAMWDAIARLVGIESCYSVDLQEES